MESSQIKETIEINNDNFNKKYKIAFLFLTIDNINFPEIWKNYFKGNEDKFTLYCHPKNPENVTVDWMKPHIIDNLVSTGWGYIVGAYHNLLKSAYSDKNNYKFITISESCVPLIPFDVFYNEIFNGDIRESLIKYMKISSYDQKERIEVNAGYKKYNFVKHYARFCLSRYHVEKLLVKENDFKFFESMHIGDEFFLTMLDRDDYIKDFAVTYDNWDYVKNQRNLFNKKIILKYQKLDKIDKNKEKHKYEKLKNKINDLKILRDDFSRNPKSYIIVENKDIKIAKNWINNKTHFFWRKFPKTSNIETFYKNNSCCLR